jgi:hypothetical protein
MDILRNNLAGVDQNPTACAITAFSLYLAFLDQLKPSHIKELQKRRKVLPKLVFRQDTNIPESERIIRCEDFFNIDADEWRESFDVVIGNPPWTSIEGPTLKAEDWCRARSRPLANRQLALAFVWKAPEHLAKCGKVCFLLPS